MDKMSDFFGLPVHEDINLTAQLEYVAANYQQIYDHQHNQHNNQHQNYLDLSASASSSHSHHNHQVNVNERLSNILQEGPFNQYRSQPPVPPPPKAIPAKSYNNQCKALVPTKPPAKKRVFRDERAGVRQRMPNGQRYTYKCSHCDYNTIHKTKFVIHERQHSGVKNYICEHCGSAFFDPYTLQRHNREKHLEKRFKCPRCEETFSLKYHLKKHFNLVHEGIRYHCSQCPYNSKFKQSVKNHEAQKHNIKQTVRRRTFTQMLRNKYNHNRPIAQQKIKRKCEQCAYEGFPFSLKLHVQRMHSNYKPYLCATCGKSFSDPSNYRRHLKLHEVGGKYKCEVCAKEFKFPAKLKIHMLNHNPHEKQFACGRCSYRAAVKRQLDVHKNKCDKAEFILDCNICDFKAYCEYSIKLHKRRVHNIIEGKPKKRRPASKKSESENQRVAKWKPKKGRKSKNASESESDFYDTEYYSEDSVVYKVPERPKRVSIKKDYPCDWCSISFSTPKKLNTHTNSAHSELVEILSVPTPKPSTSNEDNNEATTLAVVSFNNGVVITKQPIKNPPVKTPPVKNPPVKSTPAKNTPAKNQPIKREPVKNQPLKNQPKPKKAEKKTGAAKRKKTVTPKKRLNYISDSSNEYPPTPQVEFTITETVSVEQSVISRDYEPCIMVNGTDAQPPICLLVCVTCGEYFVNSDKLFLHATTSHNHLGLIN